MRLFNGENTINNQHTIFSWIKNKRGVVAVVVCMGLLALVGFIALTIDIGYLMVTRNQIQNVADAAALAATRKLSDIYDHLSYTQRMTYVCNPSDIVPVAQNIAGKNKAAGKYISINASDVIMGQWNTDNSTFTQTLNRPDAVKVIARRDDSANTPVTAFFAKMFGKNSFNVSAEATAALTGPKRLSPGKLPLPVGISKKWFEQAEFCNQPIKFNPTGTLEGCAGWHTYTSSPANASKLRAILTNIKNGNYSDIPETIAGVTQYIFTGGSVGSAFDDMQALFDVMRIKNDGDLDDDTDPNTWTTVVVVYDRNDCSNPGGAVTIIGFATVTIEMILPPPDKTIQARVNCEGMITNTRGGGGAYFGTMGMFPGLVK